MARVLVTGLASFTGPYVASALRTAGHDVFGADPSNGFDLRRPQTITPAIQAVQPEYVIHLAGLSSVTHGDAAELYAVNAVGTSDLLECIAKNAPRVRKVLLASSANVYGNTPADPIDESVAPAPVNHYACSKLAMEYLARTWFDRLPVLIARPFNYTGPGQSEQFLIPKLVAHYAERRPTLELGNIDIERDFSDVRVLADAYVRLLAADACGIAVNICSGVGRSLRSVMQELESITGHAPRWHVSEKLVRKNEVHRLVGDGRLLRRLIGEPQAIDFAATLRWMVDRRRGEPADKSLRS